MSDIFLIPISIPCPHCGEPISTGYVAKYYGKITDVKEPEKKDDSNNKTRS